MAINDVATGQKILDSIVQKPAGRFVSASDAFEQWLEEIGTPASSPLVYDDEDPVFLDLGFPPLEGGVEPRVYVSPEGAVGFRRSALPATPQHYSLDLYVPDIPGSLPITRLFNTTPACGLLVSPKFVDADTAIHAGQWATSPQGAVIYVEWGQWNSPVDFAVRAAFRIAPEGAGVEVVFEPRTVSAGDAYLQIYTFHEAHETVMIPAQAQQILLPHVRAEIGSLYWWGSGAIVPPKTISGVVTGGDGAPAAREVRLYSRNSGRLLGRTVSNGVTGGYAFETYTTTELQVVFLSDEAAEGVLLNDIVLRVSP